VRPEVSDVLVWYDRHARDLPWRDADASPWGVMVSEYMLQQTPVARVLPVWREWLRRWPSPAALAAEPPGEAVRAWGRLGYPRRAQRLHLAAVAIVTRHGGEVPSDPAALRSLPGIGEYTAAAIASFAFGQRQLVLDTNVRRVLARLAEGHEHPPATLANAERAAAAAWLPAEPATAARWSVAVMELGAQVCTAAAPACGACPVAAGCAWLAAGRPSQPSPRRSQPWHGTDRQCRGALLAVLRAHPTVATEDLLAAWDEPEQAGRCLAGLLAEGLVHEDPSGRYRL
jgi:A/G-specific adenine glycosylase